MFEQNWLGEAGAAITNYHELRGLKQQFIFSRFWRLQLHIKVSASPCSLCIPQASILPGLFRASCFPASPVTFGL